MSISGQIVSEMLAGYTSKTPLNPSKFFWVDPSINGYDLRENLHQNAHFWQVGLFDIVPSEYPDKSHDFRNFSFMMSHLSTLQSTALRKFSEFLTFQTKRVFFASAFLSVQFKSNTEYSVNSMSQSIPYIPYFRIFCVFRHPVPSLSQSAILSYTKVSFL